MNFIGKYNMNEKYNVEIIYSKESQSNLEKTISELKFISGIQPEIKIILDENLEKYSLMYNSLAYYKAYDIFNYIMRDVLTKKNEVHFFINPSKE
ncbi:MAG: hypothetical protein PHX15_01220 [Candidatus Nanoarchaeia archaeon]|jgi:hypothetical protein|nr:hypothetical protein [Candidatus Nanoarchaeia archaeon]MDD4563250.1 hypothetical protein [Candidatus Nanoarchaeia archaeon]